MGTWGEGNFANDGALDFVGDLIDSLAEKITPVSQNPEQRTWMKKAKP